MSEPVSQAAPCRPPTGCNVHRLRRPSSIVLPNRRVTVAGGAASRPWRSSSTSVGRWHRRCSQQNPARESRTPFRPAVASGCRVGAGSFTTTLSRSADLGGPKGHRGGYRKDREGPGNVRTRSPDPTIATGTRLPYRPRDAAHGRPRPPEPPRREGRENGPGRPLLPRNRGRSGRGGMRTNCYIRQQCRSIPNWREAWHRNGRTSSSSGATTSAGGTSATTAGARWATGRPTSTASPTKASPSPTTTASRAAPPAARRSSPARTRSAPA